MDCKIPDEALNDTVNAQDEIETAKICIEDLPFGALVEVETKSRTYTIKNLRDGFVSICGHPRHCPEPVVAKLCRSSHAVDTRCISEGMRLAYVHPVRGIIRTSRVQHIRGAAPKRSFLSRLSAIPSKLFTCRHSH
jgi:hypothetical protein